LTSEPACLTSSIPEQGQTVRLRHKVWVVTSVAKIPSGTSSCVHRVGLECLSDDYLGREIQVIWEREIAPVMLDSATLPLPSGSDSFEMFEAFLCALRWSASSLAVGDAIHAPFRGGIELEDYQLVPLSRAMKMPRVRLLIADDVGLGKTIEAGLIAQELIHSHRGSRILVLCPAHLKQKWVDEMGDKFGLEFRIVDRDSMLSMRKEFGPTINPWASYPRLVASIDYLKTEHPRRLFEELATRRLDGNTLTKPWDLLILDEAHNVAPAGRKEYVRDSDRTSLMRSISECFEHRVFLTATPHNGYRESFTGLLELLDSLRFTRGTEFDQKQLNAVTVRRLKEDIKNPDGSRRFPERVLFPRSPELDPRCYVDLSPTEYELHALLKRYTESRLSKTTRTNERPTQFVLTLLTKRALSSPLALRESLITHTTSVGVKDELEIGDSLFRVLEQREKDDWADDDEKEELTEAATQAASRLCDELGPDEKSDLQRMFEIVDQLANQLGVKPDSKAQAFLRWIEVSLRSGNLWNGERVIVFTEYKHTLEYLRLILEQAGYGEVVVCITGGMSDLQRQKVNEQFQTDAAKTPVRILLATDAASEGADFQRHCRNLIHYEIPWNPVRLEQRNGRIDRHGQRASQVRIHHFVFRNLEDSEFLKRIVDKVETIRADLGSVGALIAENVRLRLLGRQIALEDVEYEARRVLAKRELHVDEQAVEETASMVELLSAARESLGISDEAQLRLLECALELDGKLNVIQCLDQQRFCLHDVPGNWSDCRRYLWSELNQRVLTFDRVAARDDDSLTVLHLDHPLLKRAVAVLRMQMWHDPGRGSKGLHRIRTFATSGIKEPRLRAWGRLVILGPEHNVLHEGLVSCEAGIVSSKLLPLEFPVCVGDCLTEKLEAVKKTVEPHLDALTVLLVEEGMQMSKEFTSVLRTRGEHAAKYARELANDRMASIRKAIRDSEKKLAQYSGQYLLFDDEEREQRTYDLEALRRRLESLATVREQDSLKQKAIYQVADRRVYPVALEIAWPTVTP
jgi:SNF2 family DNA or RNA helicase